MSEAFRRRKLGDSQRGKQKATPESRVRVGHARRPTRAIDARVSLSLRLPHFKVVHVSGAR